MRILLITNMYPPHHEGGYELSCQDVVERLIGRGHEVTVLTTSFRREGVAWSERADGVIRTLDFYWRDHRRWRPRGARVLSVDRRVSRQIREVVREVDPDVISLWNLGAIPLSAVTTLIRSGRPLVHHVCNDWPSLNLQDDALQALLRRRPLLGRVASFLAGVPTGLPDLGGSGTFCWVSRSTWEHAEAATPWTFPRSTVVHSGISHNDFPLEDIPTTPRTWSGRLLYVGRIQSLKGVEAIIEALPLLPEATVELVGPHDPRYLGQILERAAELGVHDRIATMTSTRDELRQRYLSADVVLFTSLAEPFGLVPIEAMACATPVVATGAGGSKEFLVDGSNCLLFNPGDAQGLAAAVQRLAEDPDLRLRLSVAGLSTAATYSVDVLADRLEEAHLAALSVGPADR